jgi:hypothetical protein
MARKIKSLIINNLPGTRCKIIPAEHNEAQLASTIPLHLEQPLYTSPKPVASMETALCALSSPYFSPDGQNLARSLNPQDVPQLEIHTVIPRLRTSVPFRVKCLVNPDLDAIILCSIILAPGEKCGLVAIPGQIPDNLQI